MRMYQILFVTFIFIIRDVTGQCASAKQYLDIAVYNSRGLKATIRDEPGIQYFAFHGNINHDIDSSSEGGDLFGEVYKSENGFWTVYKPFISLKAGDIVNYWYEVIKNGEVRTTDRCSFLVANKNEMHNRDHPSGRNPLSGDSFLFLLSLKDQFEDIFVSGNSQKAITTTTQTPPPIYDHGTTKIPIYSPPIQPSYETSSNFQSFQDSSSTTYNPYVSQPEIQGTPNPNLGSYTTTATFPPPVQVPQYIGSQGPSVDGYAKRPFQTEYESPGLVIGGNVPPVSDGNKLTNFVLWELLKLTQLVSKSAAIQSDGTIWFNLFTPEEEQLVLNTAKEKLKFSSIFIRRKIS